MSTARSSSNSILESPAPSHTTHSHSSVGSSEASYSEHPLNHYKPRGPRTLPSQTSYYTQQEKRYSLRYDAKSPYVTGAPAPWYEDDFDLRPHKPRERRQRHHYTNEKRQEPPWFFQRWSRRKKLVIGVILASVGILIIIIAAAVTAASRKGSFDYTPSTAHVTNETSFQLGGATQNDPYQSLTDGIGAGQDRYIYYSGPASNYPPYNRWISFAEMWKANMDTLQHSCGWLDEGPDNTPEIIQDMYDAIQDRANASLVDHRYIFATILQESNGCVQVGSTTSSGGVNNPGLMQSHNGQAFSKSHQTLSILTMVQDGTQGTEHGDGLVQNLNIYGNPYAASRGYNSGYIPKSGDLSEAAGATACYVSDIANRLTGWVYAETKCHE
ncbi:hypothetical protein LTR37_013681 [Vermiconidia calcicola]|uniref:Uncharacterized protein n=1 Tax=Vermiconidia calcicola TaxID=1690605 RepID=A0ACC3MVQ8_9PEZI|nr:hypothetical protein LTR37_013681 [Vermiconidia calcicola]